MSPDCADFELCPEPETILGFLDWRYGLTAEVFAEHRFWHRPGSPAIWVADRRLEPPAGVRAESMGMMAMRDPPPGGKPTSVFLQRFAETAHRNVYVVDEPTALRWLEGAEVLLDAVDHGRGYCIVRTEDRVLGCGRRDPNTGQVHCEVPRAWREALAGWVGPRRTDRGAR